MSPQKSTFENDLRLGQEVRVIDGNSRYLGCVGRIALLYSFRSKPILVEFYNQWATDKIGTDLFSADELELPDVVL